MKKDKQKPSDKRLEAFNKAVQLKILHPNYQERVMIATILDDLMPEKLITGRKCTGKESVLDKFTGKPKDKLIYKLTRRFVVFKDKSRLSVGNEIFSHLKIDHKLPHSFENYYA